MNLFYSFFFVRSRTEEPGFKSFAAVLPNAALYRSTRDEVIIIMGVHVDDGLLGCNVDSELDIFAAEFERHVRKATV